MFNSFYKSNKAIADLAHEVVEYHKKNNLLLDKLRDELRQFREDKGLNYDAFYKEWKEVLQRHINNEANSQLFKLSSGTSGVDLTIPGHNYVGPGSKLSENKEPTSDTDHAAYLHDWQYYLSLHKEDISDADYEAVNNFGQVWETHGDLIAKFAELSLRAKILAESIFGISLYPYNL
jgi:hypothetical protein